MAHTKPSGYGPRFSFANAKQLQYRKKSVDSYNFPVLLVSKINKTKLVICIEEIV
jgi:hypothetical protein